MNSPKLPPDDVLLLGDPRDDDMRALFELLGMIAKANPPVTPEQIKEVEKFIDSHIPTDKRSLVMNAFREGKELPIQKGRITNRAFQLYGFQEEGSTMRWFEPVQVLEILVRVALSDGAFTEEEDYVANCARQTLCVHARTYWSLRDTLAERMGVSIQRQGESFAQKSGHSHGSARKENRKQQSRPAYKVLNRSEALAVLELQEDADAQTIKNTYRILVKRYHPDLLRNTVTDGELKTKMQQFCRVQEAYEVLTQKF